MKELNQQQKVAQLNGFLERLKPQQRRIFIRHYWFCNSIDEIAEMYHVRPVTVRIQLYFARMQLRSYLSNSGVHFEDEQELFGTLGEIDLYYVQESEV